MNTEQQAEWDALLADIAEENSNLRGVMEPADVELHALRAQVVALMAERDVLRAEAGRLFEELTEAQNRLRDDEAILIGRLAKINDLERIIALCRIQFARHGIDGPDVLLGSYEPQ